MKGILVELVRMTQSLTRDDVNTWRMAWQQAISIENPRRVLLNQHYRNTVIDLHLSGCMLQRKLAVMQKRFKWVNEQSGEENEELTRLFMKRWFRQFMNLSLDTPYYGYSVIQIGDVIRDQAGLRFKEVVVVPREHVLPEKQRIVKFAGDPWQVGFDYQKEPFNNWCIGMGDPLDLGLLHKVTPACISIRHIEAFWDQFAEIFGIPIRIGKTSSRDPRDRDSIANMLTNMGSAAWGLFPDGTDIEILESAKTDSYQVFDKRIERAEARISKAILGTTMTIDAGSSRSQSEVHLKVNERIIESDAQWLSDVINEDLHALCLKHGFPVRGHKFVWDESKTYTPQELTNVLQVLLQHYDVDADWLEKNLNIPFNPKEAATAPVPGAPIDPSQKKKLNNILESFFG